MGAQTGTRVMRRSSMSSNRAGGEVRWQLVIGATGMPAPADIDVRIDAAFEWRIVNRSVNHRARNDFYLALALAGNQAYCAERR